MVVEASIPGLFRTLLIIVGVIVLLRFIGQLIRAKNNMEEERRLNEMQRKAETEREQKFKNFGKTQVISNPSNKIQDVEDVDFEELN